MMRSPRRLVYERTLIIPAPLFGEEVRLSTQFVADGQLVEAAKPIQGKLLMFDGQHKTISNWLYGREEVVVKVYLNLDRQQTIQLVNSVQSKIKKLPLSPFELAAKMAEEWRDRFSRYEEKVGTDMASESGFMKWVGADERTRARQAFQDALYQSVLDEDNLDFKEYIETPGIKSDESQITENTFKTKVLSQLLNLSPLDEPITKGGPLREREALNIVHLLNLLTAKLWESETGAGTLSERQMMRIKRIFYQSSLKYVSNLLKQISFRILNEDEDRVFLDKDPTSKEWEKISKAIDRILAHPVWWTDFNESEKMRAIELALGKNQDADRAFKRVGLKTGYVLGNEDLEDDALMDE